MPTVNKSDIFEKPSLWKVVYISSIQFLQISTTIDYVTSSRLDWSLYKIKKLFIVEVFLRRCTISKIHFFLSLENIDFFFYVVSSEDVCFSFRVEKVLWSSAALASYQEIFERKSPSGRLTCSLVATSIQGVVTFLEVVRFHRDWHGCCCWWRKCSAEAIWRITLLLFLFLFLIPNLYQNWQILPRPG